jgi:serine/threonine protein kinase
VTSEDLFGDIVDAPAPGPTSHGDSGRRPGPVKVQVRERVGKLVPSEEGALPRDVAALLESFGAGPEPGDAGETTPDPKPPPGPGPPAERAPQPRSERPALDLGVLAEEAVAMSGSPDPATSGGDGLFGPYRLLERIARGGMAEVFKAKRTGIEGFEKVVAVKRILPHLSDDREFVDMFVNEAKMVAGLSHPNIVQTTDLRKIGTSYCIAMEYVHGHDLRTIRNRAELTGRPIPASLCAFVVSKVCAALGYAHRRKDQQGRLLEIVHRDISPQNVLISFEGEVKLTDFGIAKASAKASTTESGALRGKLLYMSPEQARGKPVDRRSDIFSLGILFYELLANRKPFVSDPETPVLEIVRECRLSPLRSVCPRVPEALEGVVMKALERDPKRRYQDAATMQRELEGVLHGQEEASASELARYLETLFEPGERAEPDSTQTPPGLGWVASGVLEPDLDDEPEGEKTAPGIPRDLRSVQELLKRFDSK